MNKREEILQAVIGYIEKHGYPPSFQEIGDMVNLKSKSSVHTHLKEMIAQGMLESDAPWGTPRALRVPGYAFIKVGDNK